MNDFEQHLTDITQSVWRCTLGLEVTRCDPPDLVAQAFPCRSTVRLDGAWTGTLTVSCSPELTRSVAGIFVGKTRDEVSEAEMLDALGEIANMTGGNLKAVLPGPCGLSTPRSIRGPAAAATGDTLRLHFACGARRFSVELTKEDCS
jgi:chemotaxis protein CheX